MIILMFCLFKFGGHYYRMRNVKLIASAVFIYLLIFNIRSFSQVPEALFNLKGLWVMQIDKGFLYERWQTDDNGFLSGSGFEVDTVKGDTTLIELLNINSIEGTGIFYIATVINDSGGLPVYFKLSKIENNIFTFFNPNHDYPQIIIYDLTEPNILNARIEGRENGEFKSFDFRFNKTKE